MGFNFTDPNPGAPGGRNLTPDPTVADPAITPHAPTAADPGNARLAAGLAAVRAAVSQFAVVHGGSEKTCVDLAERTFITTFAVAVRVEHSQLRSGAGIFLRRAGANLSSHLRQALDGASHIYSTRTGCEADALAGAFVSQLDEADPLPPAERIALSATACAVARLLMPPVQS